MDVEQQRVIQRPLVQIIKVDAHTGARASGGAALHFIDVRQERVIEHRRVALELHPIALHRDYGP